MGRTNIDLDNTLVREAFRLTGAKTKKELVHKALEEMVRREGRKKILELEGKVAWTGNLDQMRKARFDTR